LDDAVAARESNVAVDPEVENHPTVRMEIKDYVMPTAT
jgi:hypothetical protein